jgi:hypothetical protein
MSTLNTTNLQHGGNTTGTPNIVMASDGSIDCANDVQLSSLNGSHLAGFRNQIINGDFRIWQRGNSGFAANSFAADRWFVNQGGVVQSDEVPNGRFPYSLYIPASNSPYIRQSVELSKQGITLAPFAVETQWTLSFWVRCDDVSTLTSALAFADDRAETNGLLVAGHDLNQHTVIETSGPWNRVSRTVTIPTLTPNAGTRCLVVTLRISGATGASFWTGVQLEPGPVATPFEHRPIGTELALCQRYYQVGGSGLALTNNSSRLKGGGFTFATRMRANPTMTINSSSQNFTFCYNYNDTSSHADVSDSSVTIAAGSFARADGVARTILEVGTLANFPQGRVYMLHTDWLQFDAEL